MNKRPKAAVAILNTAHIMGGLMIAFVLMFLLGALFGDSEQGEGIRDFYELLTFLCFPVGSMLGLIVAWKWHVIGGSITIAAMTGLFILRPDLLQSIYMYVPVLVGGLYLLYWFLQREQK